MSKYKYSPQTPAEIRDDVAYDLHKRADNFEEVRLRLQNKHYQKEFLQQMREQYNKKEITGTRTVFDYLKESAQSFKDFTQKYLERLDSNILRQDKSKSVFSDIYQDVADKNQLRKEQQQWIESSRQNPAYEQVFKVVQKDFEQFQKGNISQDEMRRKAQNPQYLAAYEDNLRLNALNNPLHTLAQAEAQIQKYTIFAYRDQLREQRIDHVKSESLLEKNNTEKTVVPQSITTAKHDLENWDKDKLSPLELGKKLQSSEYKAAFESAVREQYKPGLEKEFGHFSGFNGTPKQNAEQFVTFRMQGIDTAYKQAEKYQQIKQAYMGKIPEIKQEKDLSR